eukprot:s532_g22.t1
MPTYAKTIFRALDLKQEQITKEARPKCHSGDALVRQRAASALGTLCVLSDQNKSSMVEAGAIPLLVELLKDEITKKPAVVVLRSLAEENEAWLRGGNRPDDEEQQVWKTPLVDFHDFLSLARALQVEELAELHARFRLVDKDQDGAVIEGEFLSLLPDDVALLICGKVRTLLSDAQIQTGQLLSFDDVFDVLSLCRTTSNFTNFEVAELRQAFRRFDVDNSGKIDVLEMVGMLLYMGFYSSLEHVHDCVPKDSYQESQSSQVCTQGGLCDQLQSKTELEDTQDGPARGQKRTVLAAPEASTPATKRQRSFPAEGSPAPTVLDPASPGQSVAPDASAMETTTTTAAETVDLVVDPASPGQSAPNASAAMDTATATTMETGEMETAVVDNPTAAEGVDAADAADAPFSPDGDGEGPEARLRLRLFPLEALVQWPICFETCSGIGGIGLGASYAGWSTKAQNELMPSFCNHMRSFSPIPIIEGSICRLETVASLHRAAPDAGSMAWGFACQPYSRAGDNQQGMDERSATLPFGLYAGYLLQKDFLITECVPEAASSPFVQRCVDHHLKMVPGDKSEVLLELADVWPSKRRRWWQILSKGHFGKVQIQPFPKLTQVPTIKGLFPDFLSLHPLEFRQLLLTPNEKDSFHMYGKGIDSQMISMNAPLNTALHSWGNQCHPCACGCRPAFSVKRLQQYGLFGALVREQGGDTEGMLRHVSPRELALLLGYPQKDGWSSPQRLLLAGLGQIASPLQAAWIFAHLRNHIHAFKYAGITQHTPRQVLACVCMDLFALRDEWFSQVTTVPMNLFQEAIEEMLEPVHIPIDPPAPATAQDLEDSSPTNDKPDGQHQTAQGLAASVSVMAHGDELPLISHSASTVDVTTSQPPPMAPGSHHAESRVHAGSICPAATEAGVASPSSVPAGAKPIDASVTTVESESHAPTKSVEAQSLSGVHPVRVEVQSHQQVSIDSSLFRIGGFDSPSFAHNAPGLSVQSREDSVKVKGPAPLQATSQGSPVGQPQMVRVQSSPFGPPTHVANPSVCPSTTTMNPCTGGLSFPAMCTAPAKQYRPVSPQVEQRQLLSGSEPHSTKALSVGLDPSLPLKRKSPQISIGDMMEAHDCPSHDDMVPLVAPFRAHASGPQVPQLHSEMIDTTSKQFLDVTQFEDVATSHAQSLASAIASGSTIVLDLDRMTYHATHIHSNQTAHDLITATASLTGQQVLVFDFLGNELTAVDALEGHKLLAVSQRQLPRPALASRKCTFVQGRSVGRKEAIPYQLGAVATDEMRFYLKSLQKHAQVFTIAPLILADTADVHALAEAWMTEAMGAASVTVSAVWHASHWIPVVITQVSCGISVQSTQGGIDLWPVLFPMMTSQDVQFMPPVPLPTLFDEDCGFQTFAWVTHVALKLPMQALSYGAAVNWRTLFWQDLLVYGEEDPAAIILLGGMTPQVEQITEAQQSIRLEGRRDTATSSDGVVQSGARPLANVDLCGTDPLLVSPCPALTLFQATPGVSNTPGPSHDEEHRLDYTTDSQGGSQVGKTESLPAVSDRLLSGATMSSALIEERPTHVPARTLFHAMPGVSNTLGPSHEVHDQCQTLVPNTKNAKAIHNMLAGSGDLMEFPVDWTANSCCVLFDATLCSTSVDEIIDHVPARTLFQAMPGVSNTPGPSHDFHASDQFLLPGTQVPMDVNDASVSLDTGINCSTTLEKDSDPLCPALPHITIADALIAGHTVILDFDVMTFHVVPAPLTLCSSTIARLIGKARVAVDLLGNPLSDSFAPDIPRIVAVGSDVQHVADELAARTCELPLWNRVTSLLRQAGAVADDEMQFYLSVLADTLSIASVPPFLAQPGPQFDVWLNSLIGQTTPTVSALWQHGHWIPVLTKQTGSLVQVHTVWEGRQMFWDAVNTPLVQLCCHPASPPQFRDDCGFQSIAWLQQILSSQSGPMTYHDAVGHRTRFWAHVYLTQSVEAVHLPQVLGGQTELETAVAAMLREHGVFSSRVVERAKSVLQQLGAQAVTQAIRSTRPWAALKSLANSQTPRLRLIQEDEFSQVVKARTGVFCQSSGLPLAQIPARNISPNAKGVVVLSEAELQPYAQQKQISKDSLAFLVLAPFTSELQSQGETIRFPAQCTATGEPVLLSAVMLQRGASPVCRLTPKQPVQVDTIPTQTVKILLYRDQCPKNWDEVVDRPVKAVLEVLPNLRLCKQPDCHCPCWHATENDVVEPILDIWQRDWLTQHFKRAKPGEAAIFSCMMRITAQAFSTIDPQSGTSGLYIEARAHDGRAQDERFHTVWLPKTTYESAIAKQSTAEMSTSLVRVTHRYGLRVDISKAKDLHNLIRPEALTKLFDTWAWAAKPLQPMGPSADRSGLRWQVVAASPPQHSVYTLSHGDVLIVKAEPQDMNTVALGQVEASAATKGAIALAQSMQDPWAAAAAKLPGSGPSAGLSSAQMSSLEATIEQRVLQKLQPRDVDADMTGGDEARLTSLEHQMNQLQQHQQGLAQQQQALESKVDKIGTQFDGHTQKIQKHMDDRLADQFARIEALLSKRARQE